jgi:class 3 adenylate cyclase/tetratricopeptide (TPR) repeat protein
VVIPPEEGAVLEGGERRTLTVLILDIVESTTLSSELDPEDFAEILERLGAIWAHAIEEFDGRIIKMTGDGFLAVFGYPRAHDNAAIRAVAAALGLLAASDLERESHRPTPSVRIGIHTGLTLIQPTGSGAYDFDIVGDTPAIAKRLESLAPENEILISAATAQRIEREFELDRVGTHELKGVPDPVEVWRVIQSADDVSATAPETLVGRDVEMDQLMDLWRRATDGERKAVLIVAPPGLGKSRLIEELVARVENEGRVIVLRCSELMQTTSLFPVVRALHALVGWSPGSTGDDVRGRLAEEFTGLGNPSAPDLVAGLLGIDVGEEAHLPVDAGMRRAQLLESLVAWIERQAEHAPCCLVMEDLHWADPSTIELISILVARASETRILVVMSTRPEGLQRAGALAEIGMLDLGPLSPSAAAQLIQEVAGGKVPDALLEDLLDRSDAVPLFIEELTRAVAASGLLVRGEAGLEVRGHLSDTDIPLSLADTLMMRLDGLGPARTAASAAATIGRTFDARLLSSVTAHPESLDVDLASMIDAGVLHEIEGPGGKIDYSFSHALLRDAAYESLTKRTRREIHSRIATAILEQGDRSEPAVLAHHLTESGQTVEAIESWNEAGHAAFVVAAYDEAIANYKHGLVLISQLDEDDAWRHELSLQLGTGIAYSTRFGYMSPEAEGAYLRASELSTNVEGVESFSALYGLWQYFEVRSDRERRRALGERCQDLAQLSDDLTVRLEGLSALGTTLAFEGDLERALTLTNEGIERFDAAGRPDLEFVSPQHLVAGFYAISGPLLWSMGRCKEARVRYELLQEYAEHPTGVHGPFTQAYAHSFSAFMCFVRGDFETAVGHATRTMEIGMDHGFLIWIGSGYPQLGIATAMTGDPATGIPMATDGLAAWRDAGAGLLVSYFQYGLAMSHELAGDLEAALAAADGGIDHCADHAEGFLLAELHRVRGRLLERLGREEDADDARRIALLTARAQGAQCYELGVLTDLCRNASGSPAEMARLVELHGLLAEQDDGSEGVASILAAAAEVAGGRG